MDLRRLDVACLFMLLVILLKLREFDFSSAPQASIATVDVTQQLRWVVTLMIHIIKSSY